MLYRVLTPVLIFALLGCNSKEYKKSENSNVELVEKLNSGKSEAVIQELRGRRNLSSRERYYLASAYSSEGGIDVLSLYSVLELQLFRKNALEWTDLSKEKNPYLRFMSAQEGVDPAIRKKKREERWKTYEARIIEQNDFILSKPTPEDLKQGNQYVEIDPARYLELDTIFAAKKEELMKQPSTLDDRTQAWEVLYEEHLMGPNSWNYMGLFDYYRDTIRFETMKDHYINPENAAGIFGGVAWQMMYMNILWNTYESIPIIRQLPSLSDEQQETVTLALTEYSKLIHDPEFRDVAIKNMALLVAVSLLSIYKESFDFDEVENAQDLICSFEPDSLVSNYGLIRQRVLFLGDTLVKDGTLEEVNKYKAQIEAFKAELPENLTEEQKNNYLTGVETFRLRSCFSN